VIDPGPQRAKEAFFIHFRKLLKRSAACALKLSPNSMSFWCSTNAPPYPFEWVNYNETRMDYAAALSRISARYQQRF